MSDNKKTNPIIKNWLILLLSYLVALHICYQGLNSLGKNRTDEWSELAATTQAKALVEGKRKYGIPTILAETHYPMGSIYILSFLIRSGISNEKILRLFPFTIAILILLMSITLYSMSNLTFRIKFLALTSTLLIYHSPGVLNWMGALHEHSYSLSISLLLLLISIFSNKNISLFLFLIGFFSSWIGYDFLPINIISTFSLRLLVYSIGERQKKIDSFLFSLKDTGWLVSGIGWAILLHLFQNAFYFNSLTHAVKDLIGVAGGRMNLPWIYETLNPIYHAKLKNRMMNEQIANHRLLIFLNLLKSFIMDGWIYKKTLFSLALLLVFWWWIVGQEYKKNYMTPNLAKNEVCIFIGLTLLSSMAWSFLMPWHTIFHFHFLPRHFFIIILTFFYSLTVFDISYPSFKHNNKKQLAVFFSFQAMPFLLIFYCYIHTLNHPN